MKYTISLRLLSSFVSGIIFIFVALANLSFSATAHEQRNRHYNQQLIIQHDTTIPASVEPTFPGGMKGWLRFVAENLQYPAHALANRIEGSVTVHFTVDEKGRVKDVTASGAEAKELRKEAIRLVRGSGKWIPAKQNDQPVSSVKDQVIIFQVR